MAEHGQRTVYLLAERSGTNGCKKTYWRPLGAAYPCRDGSLKVKIDVHPGLTFNIRDPKSYGEREEALQVPEAVQELPGEFDDSVFPCNDCNRITDNDEAYAVFNGGAVCEECAVNYKSCTRCEYYFPKSIRGNHCPKCSSAISQGGGK